jgi:plastocyanin
VTDTNNSKTNHHIKFSNGPDCGFTLIGKSVSVSFDEAGAYSYVCTIHPTFMKGTVTVQ